MSIQPYCFVAPEYDLMWTSTKDYVNSQCRGFPLITNPHQRKMSQIMFVQQLTKPFRRKNGWDGDYHYCNAVQRLLWLHLNLGQNPANAEHVLGGVFGTMHVSESLCDCKVVRRAIRQVWRALLRCLAQTTLDDFVFLMHLSEQVSPFTLMHHVIRHRMLQLYLDERELAELVHGPLLVWISFKCPAKDSTDWIKGLRNRRRREERNLSAEVAKVSSGHPPKNKKPKTNLTLVRPRKTVGKRSTIRIAASA